MSTMISQKTLSKYHHLQSREKKIRARREHLRSRIIQLMNHGAQIQPGKYELRLTQTEAVALTWPKVAAVLDEAMCAWLRQQIPPSPRTSLSVIERPAAKNPEPTRRQKRWRG